MEDWAKADKLAETAEQSLHDLRASFPAKAREAVEKYIRDLVNQRWPQWDSLDDDTKQYVANCWTAIILAVLEGR